MLARPWEAWKEELPDILMVGTITDNEVRNRYAKSWPDAVMIGDTYLKNGILL